MRFGLWALLALLLGAFAAHFVLADRGYVLLNFRGYVLEMSVPGLVLVLVARYLLVRGVVALVARAAPAGARRSASARCGAAAADLTQGLIHITEGDFARGERLLTQARSTPTRRSSTTCSRRARRSSKARPSGATSGSSSRTTNRRTARRAVLLTQAELQLNAGELDAALATLQRLEQLRPRSPAARWRSSRAPIARAARARQLAALLPRLGARAAHARGARRARVRGFAEASCRRADLTSERLAELWAQLTSDLKRRRASSRSARSRCRGSARRRGREELRAALKKNWHRARCSRTAKCAAPTARSS